MKENNIQKILIAILIILNLIICFKGLGQATEYDALMKEKEHLETLIETQNSMIADLEANCKDLYIEIERLRYE